jgi:hypothetical protein
MIVWVWDAQGPDRSAGGVVIDDDVKRARKLARESLLSTGASEVFVEQASVELGIKTLNYGYARTGQGWHGRRTPSGRVAWRRFRAPTPQLPSVKCPGISLYPPDGGHAEDGKAGGNAVSSPADEAPVPEIDTSRPHSARVYNYWLGGKDHFAADREVADKVLAVNPSTRTAVRENRAFLGRAVRYLAGQAGIRQFLDIGTGLPSANNVHEVAQGVAPSSRVVYVDNDPLVLAHARALLTSGPEGRTAYIHADLRQPEEILSHPATRDVLDFTQPVALMLVAILHFIADDDKLADIMATLLGALPSGSYLVASHATGEHNPAATAGRMRTAQEAGIAFQLRDSGEFARLAFTGLELAPPGVVLVSEWQPDVPGPRPTPAEVGCYGGVAAKP